MILHKVIYLVLTLFLNRLKAIVKVYLSALSILLELNWNLNMVVSNSGSLALME
jgi:hypothetical protein